MKNKHPPEKRPAALLIAAGVTCLALIGLLTYLLMPFFRQLSDPLFEQKLAAWVDSVGFGGWLFLLGLMALQIIVAFIPGGPVEILAGLLFGTWGGLFTCLLGTVAASSAIFFVVRKFGTRLVVRLFGEKRVREFRFLNDTKKVETATFLLFLIPGLPKDMLTYLAGLTKIRPARFLLLSTFARTPAILTSTMMGATMSRGNWLMTLLVFLLTAAIGLVGIRYKDRIMAHLRHGHSGGRPDEP